MSVKRYLAKISWTQIETQEHPNGEFVLWKDYANLKAEVERLRKANDSLAGVIDQLNAAKEGKPSV